MSPPGLRRLSPDERVGALERGATVTCVRDPAIALGSNAATKTHRSRAKNQMATSAMPVCGSQAATSGTTIPFVASDDDTTVKT